MRGCAFGPDKDSGAPFEAMQIVAIKVEVFESLAGATLYFDAIGLTTVTNNWGLTYLGSLMDGIKLTGGGLTLVANAPTRRASASSKR